jgi:hypothetical protein
MSVFNLLYRNSFELSCKFDIHFFLQCQINNNLRNVLINNIKKYHVNFDQLDFFSQVKIILIPDQEFLPSVVDYIKQSLELLELIWAQVKGFVAKNNTTFRLKDVEY